MTPVEILNKLSTIFTGERQRGINVALFTSNNLTKLDNILMNAIEGGETEYMLGIGSGLGILSGDKKVISVAMDIINESEKSN